MRERELIQPDTLSIADDRTLSSMLTFALLMPSFFLCFSIAIHRLRIRR